MEKGPGRTVTTSSAIVPVGTVQGEQHDALAAQRQGNGLDSRVSSCRQDAGSFLEQHALGFLAQNFRDAGFLFASDVVQLTPRKYQAVGVEALGAQLRLSSAIEEEQRRRLVLADLRVARQMEEEEFQRKCRALTRSRAWVRMGDELREFRMPENAR